MRSVKSRILLSHWSLSYLCYPRLSEAIALLARVRVGGQGIGPQLETFQFSLPRFFFAYLANITNSMDITLNTSHLLPNQLLLMTLLFLMIVLVHKFIPLLSLLCHVPYV